MAKLLQKKNVVLFVGALALALLIYFLGQSSRANLQNSQASFFLSASKTARTPIKISSLPLNNKAACTGNFRLLALDHITSAHTQDIHQFEGNGAGVAINDLNNDGLLDIVLANLNGPSSIFWNRGNFQFEKQALDDTNARAVNIVDVNGDGWQDIVFTHLTALPGYWLNEGTAPGVEHPSFKHSSLPGVAQPAHSMAWGDLNGDGALDLVAGSYDAELNLQPGGAFLFSDGAGVFYYENQGNVFNATRLAKQSEALAIALFDVNRDGHADILVGNDFDMPDQAWFWSPTSWQPGAPFSRTSQHTMSFDWGDIDNNGSFEFFATDMNPYEVDIDELAPWVPMMRSMPHRLSNTDVQRAQNVLQILGADGQYHEDAGGRGVIASGWGWSAKFGDLNDDGYLDLYNVNGMIDIGLFRYMPGGELVESNQAFRNQGKGNFSPAPEWGLGSTASGRGMSLADLNNDGRLDVVINNLRSPAQIYENQICGGGAVEVDLHWAGSKNTRAIGARLALQTSAGSFYRDVRASSGYLSGDPARVHFGIPSGASIQSLEIEWPDGQTSNIDSIAANTLLTITR